MSRCFEESFQKAMRSWRRASGWRDTEPELSDSQIDRLLHPIPERILSLRTGCCRAAVMRVSIASAALTPGSGQLRPNHRAEQGLLQGQQLQQLDATTRSAQTARFFRSSDRRTRTPMSSRCVSTAGLGIELQQNSRHLRCRVCFDDAISLSTERPFSAWRPTNAHDPGC